MTAPVATLAVGRWTATLARAEFVARDVLRKPVRGTLPVLAAHVDVDHDGAPQAVHAELDLSGVETGVARRDRDLRSRRFFDVETSGRLVFAGGPAAGTGNGAWTLPGTLTMKGITCPVELAVVVEVEDGRQRVRATTVVDRCDLGIRVPRLLVGRSVSIEVEAEMVPPLDGVTT